MVSFCREPGVIRSSSLFTTIGGGINRPATMARKTTDIGLFPSLRIIPVWKAFVEEECGNFFSFSLPSFLLQLAPSWERLLTFASRFLQERHLMEGKIRDCHQNQQHVDRTPAVTYRASLMLDRCQKGRAATTEASSDPGQPSKDKGT